VTLAESRDGVNNVPDAFVADDSGGDDVEILLNLGRQYLFVGGWCGGGGGRGQFDGDELGTGSGAFILEVGVQKPGMNPGVGRESGGQVFQAVGFDGGLIRAFPAGYLGGVEAGAACEFGTSLFELNH